MPYDIFEERITRLMMVSGSEVGFVSISREDGKYIAKFSNGVTIIGNASCQKVFVIWGSGHAAHAII